MRSYEDRICGTCAFHRLDIFDDEWICENERSECYGCETEYRDSCEDFTPKGAILNAFWLVLAAMLFSGLGNHFIDGM